VAQNPNGPKQPTPPPLHDKPTPPERDPPSKPLHDPAGDPTYEPLQPVTESTPNPASDPTPEMPGDIVAQARIPPGDRLFASGRETELFCSSHVTFDQYTAVVDYGGVRQ
jgi:hypothetical protein